MHHHIIFGAGLIGGYLGGIFTALGMSTQLVGRLSVEEKFRGGMLLTDYLGNRAEAGALKFIDPSKSAKDGEGSIPCDFLWLTVKCTGVEQAAQDMRPLIGPDTIILCCQNGLGSDQVIKTLYPANTILRVMVQFNVSEPKTGNLHKGSEGHMSIESNEQVEEVISGLVEQINQPMLPVNYSMEIEAILWAKLQLNLANSVNALSDIPIKFMLEDRSYRRVIAVLMRELLVVVKAQNMQLPKITALPGPYIPTVLSLPTFIYKRLAKKVLEIDPTARSSMWWDLSQGKKTEVDHLNGAVVEVGRQLNIPCPANGAIVKLVKEMEQKPINERSGGISGPALLKRIL